MRDPYFVQVTEKCNAHMLFEKTAEIFPAESHLISNFFQREFFGVMFIYISNNLTQSIIRLTGARSRSRQGIHRKITNQISKHQQCRAVRTHGAGAFVFYIHTCQIMCKLADVDVLGGFWIIQRNRAAIKAGRIAGRLMGEFLRGHGEVAVFTSDGDDHQSFPLGTREGGFREIMEQNYPDMEILNSIQTKE